MTIRTRLILIINTAVLLVNPVGSSAEVADAWASFLRPHYFFDKEIIEDKSIVVLIAPERAEDASMVPIRINTQIPQTHERFIKNLFVFADNNPSPKVARFHLTQKVGRADLAMRIRIDRFTPVRVIAEMNTGELFMDLKFISGSGGCSAPPPIASFEDTLKRLGKIKFRILSTDNRDNHFSQLQISHPNLSGLQIDQRTGSTIPADYLSDVTISFNNETVLTAKTDISISQDPSFRFFFNSKESGELKVEIQDSKGREFSRSFEVKMAKNH